MKEDNFEEASEASGVALVASVTAVAFVVALTVGVVVIQAKRHLEGQICLVTL